MSPVSLPLPVGKSECYPCRQCLMNNLTESSPVAQDYSNVSFDSFCLYAISFTHFAQFTEVPIVYR